MKRRSRVAKLVCVSAFAAALSAASAASASTTAPSDFAKEQAMTASGLIER